MNRRTFLTGATLLVLTMATGATLAQKTAPPKPDKVVRTAAQWRKILTSQQYYVLREAGTEYAFQNKYWRNHDDGTYYCGGCGNPLFESKTKFESGTGWPSFWKPLAKSAVIEKRDPDGQRVEVLCARCDGHLGHLFDDATGSFGIPKTPTGLRYCMNSTAMRFVKAGQPAPKKLE